MKLIITGATGAAGSEILRQALLDPRITAITVLSRRPLPSYIVPNPPSHLRIIDNHSDFSSYPSNLLDELKGYDGCLWALGTTSVGFTESEYEKVTHDYAVEAAKAFSTLKSNEQGREVDGEKFVFAYLSGAGSDQTRTGMWSTMFGRVKGRTEQSLTKIPGIASYSFRPAFIVPTESPPPSHRSKYNTPFYVSLGKMIGAISSYGAIDSTVLAKGMIRSCFEGSLGEIKGWLGKGKVGNEGVFENREIMRFARGFDAQ